MTLIDFIVEKDFLTTLNEVDPKEPRDIQNVDSRTNPGTTEKYRVLDKQ